MGLVRSHAAEWRVDPHNGLPIEAWPVLVEQWLRTIGVLGP
jgi:hypothetical protein